jgi:hypothetical protein
MIKLIYQPLSRPASALGGVLRRRDLQADLETGGA